MLGLFATRGTEGMRLEDVLSQLGALTRDAIVIAEAEPSTYPGPRIVWCNDALCQMTGYARDEIIGATPRKFQGPGTSARTKAEIRDCLTRWGSGRFELLNYRKDGAPFWVEIDLKPIADETGWFRYWIAVQREITERKSAEAGVAAQLASTERERKVLAHHAMVAQHASDAVIITDAYGRIEWVNRSFEAISGYALADVIGRKPGEFLQGPDTDKSAVRAIAAAIAARETIRLELLNYTKAGAPYWIEIDIRPVHDATGEVVNFIAIERDITERRARERDLQLAKEAGEALGQQLSLATAAASIGFWQYDVQDDVLTWDDAMLAVHGVDRGSFSGRMADWERRIHPDDRVGAAMRDSWLMTGETLARRFRILRKDGSVRHLIARAARDTTKPHTLALVGVTWDATDFVEAVERAEAGARAKASFLATMSHEIRTPLNGVIGMAEMLAHEPLTPRAREFLDVIRTSGADLMGILNAVLDFSRIEAGRLQIETTTFAPADLLTQIQRVYSLKCQEKGLAFELTIEGDAQQPRIGDPLRIGQILNNLVSNAVKFTDRGSVVVTARLTTGWLQVVVADSGIGIAPDQISQVFEQFTQADSTIGRRFGGTGLGLSIARGLARTMGGNLDLQSAVGAGSTFTVTVPCALADVAEATSAPPAAPLGGGHPMAEPHAPLRILVAEDNPTNRRVMQVMLDAFGYQADFAVNGEEAITRHGASPYDLILMDVAMPVVDGLAATQHIRALERDEGRTPVRILGVTANAMSHQIAAYRAAGMDDVVAKPLRPDVLLAAIAG